ncbi:hypothetical protein ACU21_04025 [Actinobaculum suis]|nr:hypothetical protein ACU21_04025 [Actinobaculum suis]
MPCITSAIIPRHFTWRQGNEVPPSGRLFTQLFCAFSGGRPLPVVPPKNVAGLVRRWARAWITISEASRARAVRAPAFLHPGCRARHWPGFPGHGSGRVYLYSTQEGGPKR